MRSFKGGRHMRVVHAKETLPSMRLWKIRAPGSLACRGEIDDLTLEDFKRILMPLMPFIETKSRS